MSDKHIPYTVIGGYLGAGKTTLLNSLLQDNRGLRLAILVNDFGDINIDADLITSHDGETMQLASGCICCSLADGFMQALARVRDHADRIDHIIVEASGVSDPVKVGQYGAILRYDLEGVIVLVDAEQIREKAANKYVGDTVIRQLRGADLLVLNKIDLVTAEQLAEVRAWLASVAPDVPIVETIFGRVPEAVLLGIHEHRLRPDVEQGEHEDHVRTYERWHFEGDEPLSETAVRNFLVDLPDTIFRAKGFLYLRDNPDERIILQLVGRRWSLSSQGDWGDDTRRNRIVFIGLPDSLNQQQIASILRGCEVR